MRRMRPTMAACLLGAGATLAATGAASDQGGVLYFEDFETGTGGWRIYGWTDSGSTCVPRLDSASTWNSTGGNPAGCCRFIESILCNWDGPEVFLAPASLTDLIRGRTDLTFEYDIRLDVTSTHPIHLMGAGRIITRTAGSANTGFTTMTVTLDPEGWTDSCTGAAVSTEEFQPIIDELDGLMIRTDHVSGAIHDAWLDNVRLLGQPAGGCTGDLNGDGAVDFADVLQLLAAWGGC